MRDRISARERTDSCTIILMFQNDISSPQLYDHKEGVCHYLGIGIARMLRAQFGMNMVMVWGSLRKRLDFGILSCAATRRSGLAPHKWKERQMKV